LLLFNDLLKGITKNPADVLVLRHTPRKEDGNLKKELPWLAATHPDLFNAYQQTQTNTVENKMLKAKYVASFIGLESRKGIKEHAAVFVGLYRVGEHNRLTYQTFWQKKAYKRLKQYGMRGFTKEDIKSRPFVLWFDLTITEFCRSWQGKLIIDWPPPAITWARFANKAQFPISAILQDTVLYQTLPHWTELVLPRVKFEDLPPDQCKELSRRRGIYYIFYPSDRKGYVGSAAGKDNIYGRWKYHTKAGGDSVQMRLRKFEDFEFSILQTLDRDADKQEVGEHERRWKERLHTYTKDGGLNDN
jgi:hypothetical protein